MFYYVAANEYLSILNSAGISVAIGEYASILELYVSSKICLKYEKMIFIYP